MNSLLHVEKLSRTNSGVNTGKEMQSHGRVKIPDMVAWKFYWLAREFFRYFCENFI